MDKLAWLREFLSRAVEELERLEHILLRVGIAVWHLVGLVIVLYSLFADKLGHH